MWNVIGMKLCLHLYRRCKRDGEEMRGRVGRSYEMHEAGREHCELLGVCVLVDVCGFVNIWRLTEGLDVCILVCPGISLPQGSQLHTSGECISRGFWQMCECYCTLVCKISKVTNLFCCSGDLFASCRLFITSKLLVLVFSPLSQIKAFLQNWCTLLFTCEKINARILYKLRLILMVHIINFPQIKYNVIRCN